MGRQLLQPAGRPASADKPSSLRLILKGSALTVGLAVTLLAHAGPAAEVQELARKGRGADALRRADVLLKQHPHDSELWFQKALLLAEQKRTAEAVALFERLAKENPASPEPLNNLAVLYAEQGQMDKARNALEAAVRSRPSYGTAYQNLASVNVRIASRAYSKALQIDDSQGAPKLALIRSFGDTPADAGGRVMTAATATAGAPTPPSPAAPAPATAQSAAPSPQPAPPAAPSTPPQPATPQPATPQPAAAPPAVAARPAPALPPPTPAPAPAVAAPAPAGRGGSEPATASAGQKQATDEAREVNAAVRSWAGAWARRDMDSYLEAYVPEFRGNERSSAAWQQSRRQRILGKSRISVELSGLTVEVSGDRARASFRQDYAADSLVVSSQKTLELVKRGGRWLIRKETTGS